MHCIKLSLVFCLIILVFTQETPYKKIIHNTDPQAKCLDGSPPAIYVHQGGDTSNFLIFFRGGAYCKGSTLQQTLEECYLRSKTQLGSSTKLSDTATGQGYLSTDPTISPFANWTKIMVHYCDGAFHQGNSDPIKYKDATLYLRGSLNTRSHLNYLSKKYNFTNASKVLLTGGSAGGQATYLWTNEVRSMLANPSNLYTVADSSIFMNTPSPQSGRYIQIQQYQSLYRVSNLNERTPNTKCNSVHAGQQYKCFFLQLNFLTLSGRILIIESQYDPEVIRTTIQTDCIKRGTYGSTLQNCTQTQISNIQVYRKNYLNFVQTLSHFSPFSVWTISCSQHVYAANKKFYDSVENKVPEGTGMTVKDAISKFVFENARFFSVDQVPWPYNTACSK